MGSSSMETSRRDKCKKQMEQLCFHIKDNLEFAENGKIFLKSITFA
jgi:hypothetical protein